MSEIIVDPKPSASSDYAAQLEILHDIRAAGLSVLRDIYPGEDIRGDVVEPPLAPQAAVVFHLMREPKAIPVELLAKREDVMVAIAKGVARLYPSVPMTLLKLDPPVAAQWGFVIHLNETAEKPAYPYFHVIRAKDIASIRLTDFARQHLGLGE